MHTQLLGVVLAAVLALALGPSIAAARPARAGVAALHAYRAYLGALVAAEPAAGAREGRIVDGVARSCRGALSDLNRLSPTQLNAAALAEYGDEIAADLAVADTAAGRRPLDRFAGALAAVAWPTAAEALTTARLIAGERGMQSLAAAHLCADARTLDAAPRSAPATTLAFLRRERRAAAALRNALAGFRALLAQLETAADGRLVGTINGLVRAFSASARAREQRAGQRIESELGLAHTGG